MPRSMKPGYALLLTFTLDDPKTGRRINSLALKLGTLTNAKKYKAKIHFNPKRDFSIISPSRNTRSSPFDAATSRLGIHQRTKG
jgi:hypothetical protein